MDGRLGKHDGYFFTSLILCKLKYYGHFNIIAAAFGLVTLLPSKNSG